MQTPPIPSHFELVVGASTIAAIVGTIALVAKCVAGIARQAASLRN